VKCKVFNVSYQAYKLAGEQALKPSA